MVASLISQVAAMIEPDRLGETALEAFRQLRRLPYVEPVKEAEKWLRQRIGKTFMAPMRGFQEDFVACETTVLIAGGNKGPGKSWVLLYDPTRHRNVPGFTSVIFRDKAVQIRKPGGLWSKSAEIHTPMGGSSNKADMKWSYESTAEFALAHVNGATVDEHQGIEYAHIGLDEGTHFVYGVFTTLLSCCRSTCGVPATFRITCNPDISSWVFWYVRPWVDNGTSGFTPAHKLYGEVKLGEPLWFARVADGEELPEHIADNLLAIDDIPALDNEDAHKLAWVTPGTPGAISITYIPGSLADNLYLSGTTYENNLRQLPKHERERFLYGDWMAQAEPGQYFQREWFGQVTLAEIHDPLVIWRTWDPATRRATKGNRQPDWTVGALVAESRINGKLHYDTIDVKRLRGTPDDVETLIQQTYIEDLEFCAKRWPSRPHRVMYEIAKGGAGDTAIALMKRHPMSAKALSELAGRPMKAADVVGYKVKGTKAERAEDYSKAVEQGRCRLLRGGRWCETWIREHEKFDGLPNKFDDQVTTHSNLIDWRSTHAFTTGGGGAGKPAERRHRARRR